MCQQLKTSKMTGRVICTVSSQTRETCCTTVETVSGRKVEQATYIVRMVTPSEEYQVEKGGAEGICERYTVNLWNETCECDGYANGYRCRHLRLVPVLRSTGKIK